MPDRSVTNASEMRTIVGSSADVPVDDFEINKTVDNEVVHGSGRKEPRGISEGNIEYSVDITLQGENVKVFNDAIKNGNEEDINDVKLVAVGNNYKWVCDYAIPNDETFSYSDGDPVEYSASYDGIGFNRVEL